MTKILIVDDEEDILELLDDHLSEHGFDVISAEDGAMALAQIYREQPDVVLLDLTLPVVNGYEVLKEIRSDSRTKNLPVILLTESLLLVCGRVGFCPICQRHVGCDVATKARANRTPSELPPPGNQ